MPHLLGPTPRIVVACDKFKGSLTADGVIDAISRGVRRVLPQAGVTSVNVADGGDGTLDAAVAMGFDRCELSVEGPTGEPCRTSFALRDDTAVVEMADACGLVRVPGGDLQPLTASSYGVGEVLRAALDQPKVRHVILGVGGSASTDAGAGMLQALGARIIDAAGREVPRGGAALAQAVEVDLSGLHPRLADVTVTLASDVSNPLLGGHGAAAVFGPQKGATTDQVTELDQALAHFVDVLDSAAGQCADDSLPSQVMSSPGAGAAGGVGFAAMAVLGATMRPGIELILELAHFSATLDGASLVITGEGSLDEQSLAGKTPVGVASAARQAGVPVVAVCGRLALDRAVLVEHGIDRAYALLDIEPDATVCMRDADRLLTELAARVTTDATQ